MTRISDQQFDPVRTIVEEHVHISDPDSGAVYLHRRERGAVRPDNLLPFVEGHVVITDADTGEVLVDQHNAIHAENMSQAMALSLANRSSGFIDSMVFGNGASNISGTGAITYFPPNVTGQNAALYNQTYSKVVNDQSTLNVDPTQNFLTVNHVTGNDYSDVIVTCLLTYGEPAGQDAFDNAVNVSGLYQFDELGLRAFDPVSGNGLLISHCIFNQTQKSLNRQMKIVYTLRILV